jgi:hypothetical protein
MLVLMLTAFMAVMSCGPAMCAVTPCADVDTLPVFLHLLLHAGCADHADADGIHGGMLNSCHHQLCRPVLVLTICLSLCKCSCTQAVKIMLMLTAFMGVMWCLGLLPSQQQGNLEARMQQVAQQQQLQHGDVGHEEL